MKGRGKFMQLSLLEFMLLYIVSMVVFAIANIIGFKVVRYLEKSYRGEL